MVDFYVEPGMGFPHTSREIAFVRRASIDANGYYRFLGVRRDATTSEIKTRCRELLKKHHDDGTDPDRVLFDRVSEIYTVLKDPCARAKYDHTKKGERYIDSKVLSELHSRLDNVKLQRLIAELRKQPPPHLTYYTDRPGDDDDRHLAMEWYRQLGWMAFEYGLKTRLKIFISDDPVFRMNGEDVYVQRGPIFQRIASSIIRDRVAAQHVTHI